MQSPVSTILTTAAKSDSAVICTDIGPRGGQRHWNWVGDDPYAGRPTSAAMESLIALSYSNDL